MINELQRVLIVCYVVSACFCYNKFASNKNVNRYKRESFFLEGVYFICSCIITNTIISLIFSFHINYIKFIGTTIRTSRFIRKLKVHRANSQTISSYLVRFSTDIIFSSLVPFAFCLLVFIIFFY